MVTAQRVSHTQNFVRVRVMSYLQRIKLQMQRTQKTVSWIQVPKVRVILHSEKVKLRAETPRSYGMFLNIHIVRVELHAGKTYEAMHMTCKATLRLAWNGIWSWQVNQPARYSPLLHLA